MVSVSLSITWQCLETSCLERTYIRLRSCGFIAGYFRTFAHMPRNIQIFINLAHRTKTICTLNVIELLAEFLIAIASAVVKRSLSTWIDSLTTEDLKGRDNVLKSNNGTSYVSRFRLPPDCDSQGPEKLPLLHRLIHTHLFLSHSDGVFDYSRRTCQTELFWKKGTFEHSLSNHNSDFLRLFYREFFFEKLLSTKKK